MLLFGGLGLEDLNIRVEVLRVEGLKAGGRQGFWFRVHGAPATANGGPICRSRRHASTEAPDL